RSPQGRHLRCFEPRESAEAPHISPATTAIQPPARESTYYTRVGKCVAPRRAPAKTHGMPCTSDQTPENTSRAPGRKERLPNPGRTPRAPSLTGSVGAAPHSKATTVTEAVENTLPPHQAVRHRRRACQSQFRKCPARPHRPKP